MRPLSLSLGLTLLLAPLPATAENQDILYGLCGQGPAMEALHQAAQGRGLKLAKELCECEDETDCLASLGQRAQAPLILLISLDQAPQARIHLFDVDKKALVSLSHVPLDGPAEGLLGQAAALVTAREAKEQESPGLLPFLNFSPAERQEGITAPRIALWTTLGAGLATSAVGIALALLAKGKAQQFDDLLQDRIASEVDDALVDRMASLSSEGKAYDAAAISLMVAGGASLATAVILSFVTGDVTEAKVDDVPRPPGMKEDDPFAPKDPILSPPASPKVPY